MRERSNDTHHNVAEPGKHHTEFERSQTQKATAWDSIYAKRPEQADPQGQKADWRLQGPGEGHAVAARHGERTECH